MQWSTEQVHVLIAEVETRDYLWNILSREYKDRVKKCDGWREVAEVLGREQAEVSL